MSQHITTLILSGCRLYRRISIMDSRATTGNEPGWFRIAYGEIQHHDRILVVTVQGHEFGWMRSHASTPGYYEPAEWSELPRMLFSNWRTETVIDFLEYLRG